MRGRVRILVLSNLLAIASTVVLLHAAGPAAATPATPTVGVEPSVGLFHTDISEERPADAAPAEAAPAAPAAEPTAAPAPVAAPPAPAPPAPPAPPAQVAGAEATVTIAAAGIKL